MKTSVLYTTLLAAALLFAATPATHASDGGKSNNSGSSSSGNGGSNNNGGNCNNGCNNNGGVNNNDNNATQIRLRTTLAGSPIAGRRPEGSADFRNDNSRMRLRVEVENVNLPDGTVLTVSIVHNGVATVAGTIAFVSSNNENELELDSQNGNMVPAAVAGDMVTVSNGAKIILAGAF